MTKYGWATDGNTIVSDFSDQIKDRIFAITGPSKGGIGAETAVSLAHGSPSQILLLGRSLIKIQPTIDEIHTINPSITTRFISVDLSSLASVRAAANSVLQDPTIPHIDVLINNAAIMASPYALTTDGIESQFATNHLSHFLLTNLLLPKILASIPPSDPSSKTTVPKPRIINLSSTGHVFSDIQYDDPNFQNGLTYTPWKGYGQAKTANILMAVELNSRLQAHQSSEGIRVFAVHPGSIATGLQEHMGNPEVIKEASEKWGKLGREFPERKTLSQGCSTTLWGALDPGLEGVEGVYLRDCGVVKEGDEEENVRGWATDVLNAGRLWELSERLVGEKFDV